MVKISLWLNDFAHRGYKINRQLLVQKPVVYTVVQRAHPEGFSMGHAGRLFQPFEYPTGSIVCREALFFSQGSDNDSVISINLIWLFGMRLTFYLRAQFGTRSKGFVPSIGTVLTGTFT